MRAICSKPTPRVSRFAAAHYLRGYAYRFIELCEPALTEAVIRSGVTPSNDDNLEVTPPL